jgi:hypothetical protein
MFLFCSDQKEESNRIPEKFKSALESWLKPAQILSTRTLRRPNDKGHDVSLAGFHHGHLETEETTASVGLRARDGRPRRLSCSNMKGLQVLALVAFEYENARGEKLSFVAGFKVNPNILSVISLLNRIFP